jgi:hypothetical protein
MSIADDRYAKNFVRNGVFNPLAVIPLVLSPLVDSTNGGLSALPTFANLLVIIKGFNDIGNYFLFINSCYTNFKGQDADLNRPTRQHSVTHFYSNLISNMYDKFLCYCKNIL